MDTSSLEFSIGMEAVQAAVRLCQAVQWTVLEGQGRLDKEDKSPVTIADFGAQAVVGRIVGNAFPDTPIVGEEDSAVLRLPENETLLQSVYAFVTARGVEATPEEVCDWIDRGNGDPEGRYWVLDPIDGTKGFLRGEQYAVALALVENGTVIWGFLGCPAFQSDDGTIGRLFAAQRGGGAAMFTLEGSPLGDIHVSVVSDLADAHMAESVEVTHKHHGLAHRVKVRLGMPLESVLMDSQAKYAAVASGIAEIYLRAPNPRTPDYRENIWDHAAGWLVVQEAGGRVTDLFGNPLDWTKGRKLEANRGIVASNGHVHEAILAALAAEMDADRDRG